MLLSQPSPKAVFFFSLRKQTLNSEHSHILCVGNISHCSSSYHRRELNCYYIAGTCILNTNSQISHDGYFSPSLLLRFMTFLPSAYVWCSEPRLSFLTVRARQGLAERLTILSIFVAQLSPSKRTHVLDFTLKYKTITSVLLTSHSYLIR